MTECNKFGAIFMI